MGFQFMPARTRQPITATPSRNRSSIKSLGSKSLTSEESAGNGRSTSFRRPKLLSKLTSRLVTATDKKTPATPANTAPAATTPTTALMHNGAETVSQQPKSFELQYHDTVTHTLLEEQERIRQQLFYQEEGVEVTAQFQKSKPSSPPSPSPSSSKRKSKSKTNRSSRSHLEEEEKKDDSMNSSMISRMMRGTPVKRNKKKNKDPPLPPTPVLEPGESDPVQMFPAVAKAVQKAKEEQLYRNASMNSSKSDKSASSHQSAESREVVSSPQQKPVVTPQLASPDKPFDEAADEDPTILEQENALAYEKQEISFVVHEEQEDEGLLDDSMFHCGACSPTPSSTASKTAPICTPPDQILDAFQCGQQNDFTEFSGSAVKTNQRSCRLVDSFYDNSCWTYQEAASMNRPFYDEVFARKFLKDITEDGINVLWHLPPDNGDDGVIMDGEEWSGRSVVMKIKPGSCYSTNDVEPKLVWTTMGAGKKEKVARCLVPLMAIQSVATFRETIGQREQRCGDEIKEPELTDTTIGVNLSPLEDDEDVCLFAITTDEGDVQVFEAASPRERDLFVAGLKNVIARLSFHVIVGDAGASSELYYEEGKDIPAGELPSFASPVKNMNRIAHALMD